MSKLLFVFLCLPSALVAQYDSTEVNLPMHKGIVCFEKKYPNEKHVPKDVLFDRASAWLKQANSRSSDSTGFTTDRNSGLISGCALYKIVVNDNGNYYYIMPSVRIEVAGDGCLLKIYDFYEKPVEKGISNEYSKIEYRWRDFRKGKPWSQEDKPLFKGIVTNVNGYMASFQKSIMLK